MGDYGGNLLTQVAQRFPDAVMKAILEEHCTAVHGMPTMFIAMLEHPISNNLISVPCVPVSWRVRLVR